jgi:putative membrane protein
MCHGNDASGMMGMHPSLRGAVDRLTREGVEVTIRNGRDTTPPMPAFDGRLTDPEVEQVVTYLDTLPPGPRNFGPDSQGGMMDGTMSGWMWLVPVLIVVVAVVAALALTRAWSSRPRGGSTVSPREVLDRRYAEGQLTRDEYLQQRNDIES